jgi:hypothetical protein
MKLIVSNNANLFIPLDAVIKEKTKTERLSFAFKKFFIWFGIALGSIFIPIAHFILTPCFLIASAIAFRNGYNLNKKLFTSKPCFCQKCQKILIIPEHINEDTSITCDNCFQRYQLSFEGT